MKMLKKLLVCGDQMPFKHAPYCATASLIVLIHFAIFEPLGINGYPATVERNTSPI
ncbi:MAG: hypothetical protein HOJ03_13035 [Nitrospina sp.]|jgi:hypothetical protein|nr:hypothetical protein [Nitrospina sp.]MBT5653416.1 hypothetical protein [Nitrospina sp.]MBT7197798.1 hypothetical protein [Nitrospina sp.]MBT7708323.1 hypothetical protein [Nitrospina sp.]